MGCIQLSLFGKMCKERSAPTEEKISEPCWKNLHAWNNQTLQFLDLRRGADGTKPEQLQELAQLQREILSVVQAYTKSGGTLVFSTCTINRGENEDNTAWFLENYPMFQLQEEKQLLVDEQHDGFYYAVFRRR